MTGAKTPGAYDLRAEAYAGSRPTYPAGVFDTLEREIGFVPSHSVADIGSGPGTFTQSLLDHGNDVIAVEPGDDMRAVAERLLGGYPTFHSVVGTAENTTLPDSSVDVITAAQALTWFDPAPAKREFQRILRPGGHVAFLWYQPKGDTPYMRESGALHASWSSQYVGNVQPRLPRSEILDEIVPERSETKCSCQSPNTWDQVVGGYVSAAWAPLPDSVEGARNIEELRSLFDRHQVNDVVEFRYVVTLCWGTL